MAMGLLNFGAGQPPAGLLGKYYNPAEEKRQKIFGAMSAAGAALLQGGQGNFGQVLGQGLAAANQGSQNAGINYRQDAMGYNKLAMDMKEQQEKEEEKRRLMDWVASRPPHEQEWLAVNPEGGAKMWQEHKAKSMFPAPAEPYTLGPDQLRFENGKPVARGLPKTPETVINMKGESAYEVDRYKGFAKKAEEFDAAEISAQKSLASLAQMENLISDPSFYSGFGAEQVMAVKRMTAALGGDPNQVSSMEQFNTLSKQAALDNMGGSLGTGFSNADRDFVVEQVAQLGNTPEGNKAIIASNRKMMQRKIEIARMAREYEAKNDRIDNGFMQQLSMWAEANPLFSGSGSSAPNLKQKYGLE